MFGVEDHVSGHVDVNNKRQKVINEAMEKYEAWVEIHQEMWLFMIL